MRDNKGQIISVVAFFAIFLTILVLGTLLMSFVNTILKPVDATLTNMSPQAGGAVRSVNNSFNNWWDIAIVLLSFLDIIILFISSYMVDTHPVFLVVYIIACMMLVIFGGNLATALADIFDTNGIFGNSNVTAGGNIIQYMPLTSYIYNHFTIVILGILIVSGVIMYAKFKFGRSGGTY